MRQYKFRGKRVDNEQWEDGFLDFNPIESVFVIDVIADISPTQQEPAGDIYSERFPVIPETVGQYADFFDDNDKEVCEGDIVETKYGRGVVVFRASCFMIEWIGDPEADMELLSMTPKKRARNSLKIISNIHDNKELNTKQ